ncbi:MAG: peptide ABC transporter substrate-binding protein, partial [Caldilineaceae bacterium]|nr:peptide ABC transporter substrate-binding protein [Caldilineaceae bacterium]
PWTDPRLARKHQRIILEGEVSSAVNPPSGCRFHPRCPIAEERCKVESPELREVQPGHWVACHLA